MAELEKPDSAVYQHINVVKRETLYFIIILSVCVCVLTFKDYSL